MIQPMQVWRTVTDWWRDRDFGGLSGEGATAGMGLSALLNALNWEQLNQEVQREAQARVMLAGAPDSGTQALLAALKGLGETDLQGSEADYGLFALHEVSGPVASSGASDSGAADGGAEVSEVWPPAEGFATSNAQTLPLDMADLVVWLLDASMGLRPWEHAWLGRLRASGRPLLVVLNQCDGLAEAQQAERVHTLSQQLAQPVLPVSVGDATSLRERLLPAMARACPKLEMALGREVPAWRKQAIRRAMQRAAALSGITGIEPVPLLDLPFQLLIQMRLVLRIAVIYGEPIGDRYSRELIVALVTGAGLRYLGQQAIKFIPLVGWVASALLAASGTWLIGSLAAAYFENGRKLPKPGRPAWVRWPIRMGPFKMGPFKMGPFRMGPFRMGPLRTGLRRTPRPTDAGAAQSQPEGA